MKSQIHFCLFFSLLTWYSIMPGQQKSQGYLLHEFSCINIISSSFMNICDIGDQELTSSKLRDELFTYVEDIHEMIRMEPVTACRGSIVSKILRSEFSLSHRREKVKVEFYFQPRDTLESNSSYSSESINTVLRTETYELNGDYPESWQVEEESLVTKLTTSELEATDFQIDGNLFAKVLIFNGKRKNWGLVEEFQTQVGEGTIVQIVYLPDNRKNE